jgi:hypothetical protein
MTYCPRAQSEGRTGAFFQGVWDIATTDGRGEARIPLGNPPC